MLQSIVHGFLLQTSLHKLQKVPWAKSKALSPSSCFTPCTERCQKRFFIFVFVHKFDVLHPLLCCLRRITVALQFTYHLATNAQGTVLPFMTHPSSPPQATKDGLNWVRFGLKVFPCEGEQQHYELFFIRA